MKINGKNILPLNENIGVGMIYDMNLEQNVCLLGIVLNPEY